MDNHSIFLSVLFALCIKECVYKYRYIELKRNDSIYPNKFCIINCQTNNRITNSGTKFKLIHNQSSHTYFYVHF